MARRGRIVFVDDEINLIEAFAEYLADLGHEVSTVTSGRALDERLARGPADLIVLDLKMPGESGLDILRRLRKAEAGPVMVMSANADDYDRVVALELGADDVLAKPIDPRELAARALRLLARYGRVERELVRFERTSVDLTACCVLREGAPPERLAIGEVMLIRAFTARPNMILSREDLLRLAPAEAHDVHDKAIDSRIRRLRAKLDTESIVTVRGRGYMYLDGAKEP